jgi:putative transposase
MIERNLEHLSISRQCELLGVPRSSFYYEPIPVSEFDSFIMKEIDKIYTDSPSYGSRRIKENLARRGSIVNRKKVVRLMQEIGIQAIYPKPKIRTTFPGNIKYPYLLKGLDINGKNQVWGTDITYIPVNGGYLYLVAYVDLFSRFVLSWSLSNSLESEFCITALEKAFEYGIPQIINSDQGVQYTSHAYIDLIRSKGARISMSGKGKCWDNIFVERFWRTLKYEEVYLWEYEDGLHAHERLSQFITKYNQTRLHSALDYQTPMEVYLR